MINRLIAHAKNLLARRVQRLALDEGTITPEQHVALMKALNPPYRLHFAHGTVSSKPVVPRQMHTEMNYRALGRTGQE